MIGGIAVAFILLPLFFFEGVALEKLHAYASITDKIPHFNFAAVGDWDCTQNTEETVDNIIDKDPELIIGLGDYSYDDSSTDCWLEIVDPIDEKMQIAIGNHDDDHPKLSELMEHFSLSEQYYSFDYENVHFIVLATEEGYLDMDTSRAQEQLAFVKADLDKASSNPDVDWIIPFFHQMMYYESEESSIVEEDDHNLREIYHPLFEQYGVELVLQAHSHTYERTYPLKFNSQETDEPIITSTSLNDYSKMEGLIVATVGTAGAPPTNLHGDPHYTPIQYKGLYGFLNIDVLSNSTLVCTYYSNNNEIRDKFTIVN